MRQGADADAPGGRGASAWRKVGWSPTPLHGLYSLFMRLVGEGAYRLIARDEQSGLVAFGIVAPGRLSRSGQPDSAGWRYLRKAGVRTIVNLRIEDDRARRLRDLGFRGYLHLPIPDGLPPTEEQAVAFLRFIQDPGHWPVHVHCLTGIQRSGTMVALARYAVAGWPLGEALREARGYFLGPTRLQVRWLCRWAARHPPREYPWPAGH